MKFVLQSMHRFLRHIRTVTEFPGNTFSPFNLLDTNDANNYILSTDLTIILLYCVVFTNIFTCKCAPMHSFLNLEHINSSFLIHCCFAQLIDLVLRPCQTLQHRAIRRELFDGYSGPRTPCIKAVVLNIYTSDLARQSQFQETFIILRYKLLPVRLTPP